MAGFRDFEKNALKSAAFHVDELPTDATQQLSP
jgi:hypothetical protein